MWQRNKSSVIVKVLLLILSLALVAGLFFAVKETRGKEEAQDAELMEIYNLQQAQQQQDRQAALEAIQQAYEQDMATVAKYMPGIVCWGDVLTGGTAGGVSYPTELQELLNVNLCDLYDFRSTIKNADDFNNRLNWDDYFVEIPVYNMGTGLENVDTILGRSGAIPFVTATAFEIPARGASEAFELESSDGADVWPLSQSDVGVNDVTIAGISGKLSTAPGFSVSAARYVFTRNEDGEAVQVSEGETVVTAASGLYNDCVPVIFVGSFGGYGSPEELVEKINAFLDLQADPSRYIIIGTYYSGSPERGKLLDSAQAGSLETTLSQVYGGHYINLRKYLVNECLNDLGMRPDSYDNRNMASGMVPHSLLSKENGIELIPSAYRCLGRLVYERIVSLGYLDEIVDELEIANFGREIK